MQKNREKEFFMAEDKLITEVKYNAKDGYKIVYANPNTSSQDTLTIPIGNHYYKDVKTYSDLKKMDKLEELLADRIQQKINQTKPKESIFKKAGTSASGVAGLLTNEVTSNNASTQLLENKAKKLDPNKPFEIDELSRIEEDPSKTSYLNLKQDGKFYTIFLHPNENETAKKLHTALVNYNEASFPTTKERYFKELNNAIKEYYNIPKDNAVNKNISSVSSNLPSQPASDSTKVPVFSGIAAKPFIAPIDSTLVKEQRRLIDTTKTSSPKPPEVKPEQIKFKTTKGGIIVTFDKEERTIDRNQLFQGESIKYCTKILNSGNKEEIKKLQEYYSKYQILPEEKDLHPEKIGKNPVAASDSSSSPNPPAQTLVKPVVSNPVAANPINPATKTAKDSTVSEVPKSSEQTNKISFGQNLITINNQEIKPDDPIYGDAVKYNLAKYKNLAKKPKALAAYKAKLNDFMAKNNGTLPINDEELTTGKMGWYTAPNTTKSKPDQPVVTQQSAAASNNSTASSPEVTYDGKSFHINANGKEINIDPNDSKAIEEASKTLKQRAFEDAVVNYNNQTEAKEATTTPKKQPPAPAQHVTQQPPNPAPAPAVNSATNNSTTNNSNSNQASAQPAHASAPVATSVEKGGTDSKPKTSSQIFHEEMEALRASKDSKKPEKDTSNTSQKPKNMTDLNNQINKAVLDAQGRVYNAFLRKFEEQVEKTFGE